MSDTGRAASSLQSPSLFAHHGITFRSLCHADLLLSLAEYKGDICALSPFQIFPPIGFPCYHRHLRLLNHMSTIIITMQHVREGSNLSSSASSGRTSSAANTTSTARTSDGDDLDELVAEIVEWPSDPRTVRRYGCYGERDFLVDLDNPAAYTQPRPAPSPNSQKISALTAARSYASPPPIRPLPPPPAPEPLISISYDSTHAHQGRPPERLPINPPIPRKDAQSERREACECPGVRTDTKRKQPCRQGDWLKEGTLKGIEQQEQDHGQGQGYWLAEARAQSDQQSDTKVGSDVSGGLWKRMRNSVRKTSSGKKRESRSRFWFQNQAMVDRLAFSHPPPF